MTEDMRHLTPHGQPAPVPNAVFGVGDLIFADDGEDDRGTAWVLVYKNGQAVRRLPLDEAPYEYPDEWIALLKAQEEIMNDENSRYLAYLAGEADRDKEYARRAG